jgi:hypothetical protein
MAKRFFETDLWKESWYRKLMPKYKCFWYYIHAQCDQAGIWSIDFELASHFIGEEIDELEVRKLFEDHIIIIDNDRWLIKDFVRFQYGETLNPNSKPHKKVIGILKVNTKGSLPLLDSLLDTLSIRVSNTPKDKEEDKEKDKD